MSHAMNIHKKLVYPCLIIVFILSPYMLDASYNDSKWAPIPLTSSSQRQQGLMGGEGMQMIFGITYAPNNPDIVYMVSDTSQVWKSTDGGNTWQMKHIGFFAKGGISIAIDPINENIVYVAGSNAEPFHSTSHADGIYRTLNGGQNWTLVKKTQYFRGKEGIHFAFDQNSSTDKQTKVIYAATHVDGLLKSFDGGTTWSYLGLKGNRIFDVKINPKNPSKLIIATQDGLYTLESEGGVKKLDSKGLPLGELPITNIALDSNNPKIIYAAVRKAGVFRSDDEGNTFHPLNNGLIKNLDYNQISVCNLDSKYIYVSVDRYGGLNPFWSDDGGKSWHKPDTLDKDGMSLTKGRYFSAPVAIHPKNCTIALTSANGVDRIIKTTNGGKTWNYSNSGYTGGIMGIGKSSLAFYENTKKMIFFLIDFGPAYTEDGGNTFRLLNVPRIFGNKTTPVGAVNRINNEELIITAIGGWYKQSLVLSRNNGNTWEIIQNTEDNYKYISFHPQNPNIIYAQGFISKDSGISWKNLSQKVYAVFRGHGDTVYSIDIIYKNKSVIKRSNDQGESWTISYPELPIETKAINEIDIDPLNSNRIYVASNEGFYIYDDKNEKWVKKGEESGFTKDYFGLLSFKCVAVDPKHPEVIYVGKWAPGKGHSNGIFRSTDYGNTWENITYNLGPEFTAWSLAVSPHDGTVYVGSSHGTWKLSPP